MKLLKLIRLQYLLTILTIWKSAHILINGWGIQWVEYRHLQGYYKMVSLIKINRITYWVARFRLSLCSIGRGLIGLKPLILPVLSFTVFSILYTSLAVWLINSPLNLSSFSDLTPQLPR